MHTTTSSLNVLCVRALKCTVSCVFAAIPSHRIERTPSEFSPRFVTLRDCKNPGHSSPPPPMPDDTMHEARGDLRSAARDSEQNDEFGGFKKSTTPLKHHAFEIVSSPPPLPQRDD